MLGYVELSIPETQISGIYKQYNTTNELFLIDKNGQVQSSNGSPELDSQYEYMDLILKNLDSQYFLQAEICCFSHLFLPLTGMF